MRCARVVAFIVAVALLTTTTFECAAKDHGKLWWPQFRGPNSSGVAGEGTFPTDFGPSRSILWKTAVPSGVSSPIVWENRIFLTAFMEESQTLETLCVSRLTGEVLWRRAVPAEEIEEVHAISSPAAPTPATDGERVYVYFGSYGLVSYDLDGNQQWERPLPLPLNYYGTAASPIVAGDLLLVNHQGRDSHLLAVNRRTGDTVWKKDRLFLNEYGWSTPVHWRHDDVDEVVLLGGDMEPNQRLMAYNLADGSVRWWVGGLPPSGKTTPVIGGGLLFLAAPDIILGTGFVRTNPTQAAEFYAGNAASVLAVRPGGQGELTQANIAWRERGGVPGVPSPLYYDGHLYLFKNGGIVFCRDATTGKLVYRGRLGAGGEYYSSPVVGDGKVYAASADGVVVVLEAGDVLKVLARNDLGERIMATPALVDGNVYVRTEGHLYAFGNQR